MSVERKTAGHVEIKNSDRGEVEAVFSTFNVVDSDGDVTLPGAFTDGEEVLISAYGHTSWQGALPVGKGRIRTVGNEAILDGHFFMDTSAGRDTFAVVKAIGGAQNWSFGFDIVDSEPGEHAGQRVRYLRKLKVHEASPVLIGAGVNTRTVAVKAADDPAAAAQRELVRWIKSDLDRQVRAELLDIRHKLELDEIRDRQRIHRRNR